jgi:surface antigen
MRLNLLKTGLFLVAVTCFTSTAKANAQAPNIILASDTSSSIAKQVTDSIKVIEQQKVDSQKVDDQQFSTVTHSVKTGESLTMIAQQYQTTWTRLFDKNTQIKNPNVISVNDQIAIPGTNEQLTARPIPVDSPPMPQASTTSQPKTPGNTQAMAPSARGGSAGNSYGYGYCTWYVKNRRPDMPNNLGNANTWVARAAAQGFATGSVPRPGAVGQQGMHVVYVESVNTDGTVTISEMNHVGWNVVNSRTVPASYFQYIY